LSMANAGAKPAWLKSALARTSLTAASPLSPSRGTALGVRGKSFGATSPSPLWGEAGDCDGERVEHEVGPVGVAAAGSLPRQGRMGERLELEAGDAGELGAHRDGVGVLVRRIVDQQDRLVLQTRTPTPS